MKHFQISIFLALSLVANISLAATAPTIDHTCDVLTKPVNMYSLMDRADLARSFQNHRIYDCFVPQSEAVDVDSILKAAAVRPLTLMESANLKRHGVRYSYPSKWDAAVAGM